MAILRLRPTDRVVNVPTNGHRRAIGDDSARQILIRLVGGSVMQAFATTWIGLAWPSLAGSYHHQRHGERRRHQTANGRCRQS